MHITILAIGSRGDIVPYIPLSQGLMSAGHTVCLATHKAFEPLVRSYALPFFALDDEPKEFFQTDGTERLLALGTSPLLFAQHFAHTISISTPLYMQRAQEVCQDADIIIISFASLLIGHTLAEKFKKRLVMTIFQHGILSTTAIPEPSLSWLLQVPAPLNKVTNQLSHMMAQQFTAFFFLPAINKARKNLYNLPPLPHSFYTALPDIADLILCAFSPLLLPKPSDWGKNMDVVGFWMPEHQESWQPDSELIDFLHAGAPPIYIGFGSMSSYLPDETIAIVEEALTQIGQRGILLVDKYAYKTQKRSDSLYLVNDVAHDWLFPQMQVIVHHGGAGTTATALRAGVPTIIIPFLSDQWFWGYQIEHIGVGPRPISRKQLTAKKLAKRLKIALTDQEMRKRARDFGVSMSQENGVEIAVAAISKLTQIGNS